MALWGCGGTIGCLGGEQDCRVQPACETLTFTCDGGEARLYQVQTGGVLLNNNQSLMSPGDWVLDNGKVMIVISALDHPHYLAPTGGNLLDMATYGADGVLQQNDSLRNIYQVGGLLPTEALAYTRLETFMENGHAVVQVRGTYDDDASVDVYTRYELGPCDSGVRVRTEMVNRHTEPESVFLADAHYIGGRESLSFAPGANLGLEHPAFGLSTLADGLREIPWMAAGAHEEPGSAQSFTPCTNNTVQAIMSEEISAIGLPPTLLRYGDYLTYDRFIGVGAGSSIAAGADIALAVRESVFGESRSLVSGRLSHAEDDGRGFRTGRPQVLIFEGDATLDPPDATLLPVNHVEPDATDGSFAFAVAGSGTYTAIIERFGLPWGRQTFQVDGPTTTLDLTLSAPGKVSLQATVDGVEDHALVVVWPADDATLQAVQTDYLGHFLTCAPMLGHPYGAAPSCNRVLVNGPHELDLPPGTYDFYSVAGPFSTMAIAEDVVVAPWTVGTPPTPVPLAVQTLPLIDAGQLTADFHVHGSASFDSSIPDSDRVRAMLASRLDVIAATDHDQVHDYAQTMEALQAHDRLKLLVGLETTGHILQPLLESSDFPKVVGHFIVWPLPFDPEGPWRGAPWDEKAQPGNLFTRFEDAGWPADTGVIQLNHPWGGLQFGRDFGWATALEMDLNRPLTGPDAPEGHRLFKATPQGSRFANDAYHAQEVMNGTDNLQFLQYRAIWHYLLTQGEPRTGTANSDSHTLGGNILGFPQNVVTTGESVLAFDQPAFNAAVREGRLFGTNGPVLNVRIDDGGTIRVPRIDATVPVSGELVVDISAASWVPIPEARIYVDGVLAETLPVTLSDDPSRPGVRTASFRRAVSSLVSGAGDHWLNVEVGAPLQSSADLDCNGVPDTDDNNGDGVVDWRDVEAYVDLAAEPESDDGCFSDVGPIDGLLDPLALPVGPYQAVVPNGEPLAFSNPFLFDGDGSGTYTGVSQ